VSERVGLERLCEQIVVEHDYDLAVLAQWDGRRRYANLRKLARLARSYESLRGPDVEGFIRFLRDQEAAGAREVEAASEEEGADAVRLLTVHAAKGLEFKVVVLADAGRVPPSPAADEILVLPDGRFGFRVVNPATGRREPVFGWDEMREAEQTADQAENRRLLYVAMTRAIDRLIVSGAVDPASRRDAGAPLHWILRRLEVEVNGDGGAELERGEARLLLRVDRPLPPGSGEGPDAGAPQLQLFAPTAEGAPPPAPVLPELAPVPAPPGVVLRRLSYSALALFDRCSYRFYAERIVGLRPADGAGTVPGGTEGLAATEIGDAVHVLLEHGTPADGVREAVLARYPAATEDDLVRIEELVAAWHDSPLARELAETEGSRPELGFAFAHDGVLVHGRFDLLRRVGGRALVVDYKTNRLEETTPEESVEREYRLQRLVYALAAFRAGADEVEVAYVYLERPAEPVRTAFARADVPELEAELSEAIRAIQENDFRPTPSEFACAGCPALDVVCAGPRLLV
jgi:ATP-dependent exoDNAse (exonuclease V) beta subunit